VLITRPSGPLRGRVRVPGDKSISHRAAILGAIASGTTIIHGFLGSEDCLNTLRCVSLLGASVSQEDALDAGPGCKTVVMEGAGAGGLREPDDVLYVGNSGTAIRLISGVLAGQPFLSIVTGDEQVRRRPMGRIATPLRIMGATVLGRQGGTLAPLAITGGGLHSIRYQSPVASAQVKSAVLLAGLFAEGETTVCEPARSRDHTERMLPAFGASVAVGGNEVSIRGPAKLFGREVRVPGDPSSAAFPLVAALLVPDSDVVVERLGLNPTRTGLLDVLAEMGARIEVSNVTDEAGEPVGDVRARHSRLKGTRIGGTLIPRLVDEVPILGVAAALAEGETLITDARELRVKETDRIRTTAALVNALGGHAEELEDGLRIVGVGRLFGTECDSGGDHRIAMAAAVAGLVAEGETRVLNAECIATSFPGFAELMEGLHA